MSGRRATTAPPGPGSPTAPGEPRARGSVALVGAGPGEASLITVRGLDLLRRADVVVIDRLAPHELLEHCPPGAEVIDVSKRPGHHLVPQDGIDALLVERARGGARVVRLKGGDPFVLGRGGEEVQACREAGIDVEVVPGVTSAVAVPAAAGIPVTHRGLARGFSVVSAHEDLISTVPARRDHTLVLLMGVTHLARSVSILLGRGADPLTPAAVVESGLRPDQRVTTTILRCLTEVAASVGVAAPAVIVLGDVVTLSPLWEHRVITGS
ncbi:uroporphyrinogen-III C-methyltransferase [Actinomyces marmotae]|uniref:uroporphyrinogen-III C-methyltransferase n=1 Tax=Actinomyces marmotae TaxID=2737173 RepID=A0A6M8B651_9ACTO|nr:uroporphyrinogen-III C-methyltransferase [Actinomyces marmotae]QKD80060.1 uroporphyrinogen-III C-methyltransferase [Actinomyces marmotae]